MQNILTFIKNGQKITLDASLVQSVKDTGNGFEITLKSGEVIQAESYSISPNNQFIEQVSSQQVENNSEAEEKVEKDEVLKEKSLLDSQAMLWGGAAIALGGIAVAASSGGDSSAPSDRTPPASLTKILSKDGKTITGLTEAGATVTVENIAGQVIGSAKAGADGTFLINLDKAYINGETLKVSAQDAAGNSTVKQELIASDITAPTLAYAISSNGKTITGLTEANSTVTVKDLSGKIISTAKSDNDGKYTVILDKAYLNGENLTISAEDLAGNNSTIQTILADDKTAPSSLTAIIDAAGKVVTGTTEANAVVTIKNTAGTVIGTATADATGKYSITLDKAYLNGESLSATAADKSGNATAPKTIVAPDTTAPSSLTTTIDTTGKVVTGVTEANAVVTVKNTAGTIVGTATADATGKYSVTLDKAYLNGESLSATAADKSGNATVPKTIVAPDTTAPSSLTTTIDTTGKVVTGVTEANAVVTVKNTAGTIVGTATADATGKYSVTLDKAYLNGESLSATAADKSGNATVPKTIVAPDTTAPSSLTTTIDTTGKVVTGVTEANAVVTVKNTAGTIVGTATADATGKYSVTLDKAYLNGESLSVTAADQSDNKTEAKEVIAPDSTPPILHQPTIQGGWAGGQSVQGTTEANATIIVKNAAGDVSGSAIADASGYYNVILNTVYEDGELLKVIAADAKGNESSININAPDTTAPILANLFNYDVSTDKIIFNAPSDSYIVEQKIDDAWVQVNVEEKFDWLNVEYRVTAIDQAGNSSQPLTTIINTVSGTYKPTDPTFTQIIKGSTGNDYLYGGNGDDTLISNGGSDSLYGGSGNDTLIYGGNSPNVYTGLIGEAGNDTYIVDKALLGSLSYVHILDNTNEQNTLYLKSVSADEIILKQVSADRVITFNDSTATIHFGEGQLSSIVFDDGTVWNKAQIEANIIGRLLGTDGDDHLQADANYSVIYGLDGNDTIQGGIQDDYLYGGSGDDTLISNTGSDHLYGGSGNDTLIYGGNSPNVYTGLIGEAGNDTYIVDKKLLGSNSYVHILDNINEQNMLYLKSVSPDEIILKQASTDRIITFSDSTATIHFGEGQLSSIVFDDGTTWDKVQIEANIASKLLGTNGEDHLQADANYSVIYGLDGNDTIQGGIQDDYLYGGSGDDTLISNTGSDHLYGGSGNDTLIYGGNSSNVYTGLIGEAGNDTYIVDKALLGSLSYVHILDNTNEQNTLYLKSVLADEIILKQASADRVITFNDSSATIHFGEGQLSSIVFDDGTTWGKVQIEQHIAKIVVGTVGNDIIETATANQTYSYTLNAGADTLIFKVLDNTDNLGGNAKSEWTDFNLVENDKIDLSQLLINDNGDLQDYISVKDTEAGLIISVDRDGSSQSTYHSQELILLTGKHDTLENLIASNTFIH
ncbi:Ig-like domain-containing protein [Acinetobacter seifertii]|uniref:Ig-like domain-containing protein n=1 Tax=Acinetobacter seifertii TaxID=1530123 RepID=UPI001F028A56|nr:Ig-like domain-containing protein [Acinetobacter seifertii]MCG8283960.1 Ig-like domain-containing protein [Acinetobacter seifertii]